MLNLAQGKFDNLRGALLAGIETEGSEILCGKDLEGADFRSVDLRGLDLRGLRLQGVRRLARSAGNIQTSSPLTVCCSAPCLFYNGAGA